MEIMAAATLFQAAGSIIDGIGQYNMYNNSAKVMEMQAVAEGVNNSRAIAVEKAAVAQESLDRTKRLQRIIGSTISAGSYAGLATDMGVIQSVNENSMFEAGIEERIARSNSAQRQTSMNLDSAARQLNLNMQASQARAQASSSLLKGFMGAASSGMSYYQFNQQMGGAKK